GVEPDSCAIQRDLRQQLAPLPIQQEDADSIGTHQPSPLARDHFQKRRHVPFRNHFFTDGPHLNQLPVQRSTLRQRFISSRSHVLSPPDRQGKLRISLDMSRRFDRTSYHGLHGMSTLLTG